MTHPNFLQDALDIFCVAHALGWFGKALILRDYWFCWVRVVFPYHKSAISDSVCLDLKCRVRVCGIQPTTSAC